VILLVAATEPELCGRTGLACGVGPVEAAAATARALATDRPDAVLHVGVAGGRGLEPGTLVVGTESVYADISAAIPVISRAHPDATWLDAAIAALPEALPAVIVTSATVGRPSNSPSRGSALAEGMEGFAVLRACELAGVPAVEVRAVSNEIGEEDRSRWDIPRALQALADALPRLLAALPE
jgi:futalosine hydrolase